MSEMIKRRKDKGFTLIELMIVIAVIGILAIVLVPKVGSIKTQAKSAGIDTNVRMVQGYVQSRITSWSNSPTQMTASLVADDIYSNFHSVEEENETEAMKNPISGNIFITRGDVAPTVNGALHVMNTNSGEAPTNDDLNKGMIIVSIEADSSTSAMEKVHIFPYDASGKVMLDKTITITP